MGRCYLAKDGDNARVFEWHFPGERGGEKDRFWLQILEDPGRRLTRRVFLGKSSKHARRKLERM